MKHDEIWWSCLVLRNAFWRRRESGESIWAVGLCGWRGWLVEELHWKRQALWWPRGQGRVGSVAGGRRWPAGAWWMGCLQQAPGLSHHRQELLRCKDTRLQQWAPAADENVQKNRWLSKSLCQPVGSLLCWSHIGQWWTRSNLVDCQGQCGSFCSRSERQSHQRICPNVHCRASCLWLWHRSRPLGKCGSGSTSRLPTSTFWRPWSGLYDWRSKGPSHTGHLGLLVRWLFVWCRGLRSWRWPRWALERLLPGGHHLGLFLVAKPSLSTTAATRLVLGSPQFLQNLGWHCTLWLLHGTGGCAAG